MLGFKFETFPTLVVRINFSSDIFIDFGFKFSTLMIPPVILNKYLRRVLLRGLLSPTTKRKHRNLNIISLFDLIRVINRQISNIVSVQYSLYAYMVNCIGKHSMVKYFL